MKIDTDSKKIEELLTRGVTEVIVREHLEKRLRAGEKLRIKFGIDPTGSDLHIGHAVPLRKLGQFQKAGHQVILLIGDYTAMIGDPSGRNETRPLLKLEQIKENMKTYLKQASKVIDLKKVEVRYNSEWYGKEDFMKLFMDLTGRVTIARVLERDDFQKRIKSGSDIRMQEILYPVLQGYDSVALKADVELGGTDQKFNLLMGRRVQRVYNQDEQDIVTTPVLEGIDGEKKMSKTYGNYIGLMDSPEDMFGKAMSVPDNLIIKYFELATEVPMDKVEEYKEKLASGANPKDIKMELASTLTELYHGKKEAEKGRDYFIKTFSKKEMPDEMPEIKPSVYDIISALVESSICKSKSEARQNIEQGGVKINGNKVSAFDVKVKSGDVVQKGSRFFVKIK